MSAEINAHTVVKRAYSTAESASFAGQTSSEDFRITRATAEKNAPSLKM